jgi:tRNA-specific 2-thiouridylase
VLAGPDGETVVGHHDGVARFTPGQRKGLGVASHAPLYVLDVDAGSGRVLVGHDGAALEQARVLVDKLAWHAADDCERVHVQLRYRARDGAIPARLVRHDDGTAELELDRASRAPAPGQAAILYDDDGLVVASGRISRDPAVARLRSDR